MSSRFIASLACLVEQKVHHYREANWDYYTDSYMWWPAAVSLRPITLSVSSDTEFLERSLAVLDPRGLDR